MDILEEAVKRAMNDPKCRAEFYRVFLESDLFIPHGNTPEELKIEGGRLSQGVQLKLPSIPADGHNWLPVFSSMENLSKSISQQTQYVKLRGRDFLEIVQGAHVVLNPGGYGKQLLPDEIAAMLSGEVFRDDYGQSIKSIKTEKPEQILLGQPKHYPQELVDVLKKEFAKNMRVKRAFLAHGFIPSHGVAPHTIIGIETDDYSAVVRMIEPCLKGVVAQYEVVDFVPIQHGHTITIAEYMVKETQPFYVAAKPGFWSRLLRK